MPDLDDPGAGKASFQRRAAPGAGASNNVSPGDTRASPQLAVAMNTAPSGVDMSPAPAGALNPQPIFDHVAKRLAAGLDAVWASKDGAGGVLDTAPDEEKWARLITEILFVHRYGSPAGRFYGKWNDGDYFDMMLKPMDGCYPLASACQQLCTAALISRGFTHADLSGKYSGIYWGIGASPGNDSYPAIASGGQYLKDVTATANSIVPAGATPGAMLIYYDPNGVEKTKKDGSTYKQVGNNEGDHIGFVLRVRQKSATDPFNAMQFFDTGALNSPRRYEGVEIGDDPGHIFIHDDKWVQTTGGPRAPAGHSPVFKGVLVPAPAPDLAGGMGRMRRLFPLGFARLVIRERQSGSVKCHTALMRMNDPSQPDMNFSFARLLWSLRDAPFCDQFETCWQVSIPRGGLLQAVRDGTRADLIPKLVQAATLKKAPSSTSDPLGDPGDHMRLRDVYVDAAGKVHVRDPAPQDTLPWGASSGISFAATGLLLPFFWGQGI